MLEFKGVNVSIQTRHILRNIDLTFDAARIAILGNNGSGKTTLARCAVGLLRPQKGTIYLDGNDIIDYRTTLWKHINLCFQVPDHQIVMPTVQEELSFSLKNAGKQLEPRVLADILEELECTAHTPCHQLSTGKKRLLCLHALLLLNPKILILDEPTAFLDIPTAQEFMQKLERLSQKVIMITHNDAYIRSFDEAVLLHQGTIVAHDTPKKIIAHYDAIIAKRSLQKRPL